MLALYDVQEAELAEDLKEVALAYHRFPTPGKISVTPTKDLANQRDLAAMSLSLLKFVGQASLVDDAMLPS